MPVTLELAVPVRAPAATVFSAVTDWESQAEWMLGTKVRVTEQGGVGVGGGLAAFTGWGPVGFLDTMTITRWEAPHRVDVRHTGRLVRGTGTFEVRPQGPAHALFVWREDLDLPFGPFGRLVWRLGRPAFAAGVRLSLRRFARTVEASAAA